MGSACSAASSAPRDHARRRLADREGGDVVARFAGQADGAVSHRPRSAGSATGSVARDEGADRRLDGEMAATLKGQGGVQPFLRPGDGQHAGADAGVDRAEVVIPRGKILRGGGADGGLRGNRARINSFMASPIVSNAALACLRPKIKR